MINEFFPPRVSEDSKFFWEGCRNHRLLVQRCRACGTPRWPPAYLCSECLSEDVEIVALSPCGVVSSLVVFHRPFAKNLEGQVPYVVATIDMGEGVMLLSNIVNSDPAQINPGSRVMLSWVDGAAYTRPVFELGDALE